MHIINLKIKKNILGIWHLGLQALCLGYIEIKLFRNYFSLVDVRLKYFLSQRAEACLKLFQNYFRSLLQLMNIFHHIQSRWNNFEIISRKSFSGWNTFLLVSDVTNCEIKHWSDFKIISMFYFTCDTTVLAAPTLRISLRSECPLSTHLWRWSSGWFPAVDRFTRGPHTGHRH